MIDGRPVVYLVGDDDFTRAARTAIANELALRVIAIRFVTAALPRGPFDPDLLEAIAPDLVVLLGWMDRVPDELLARWHVVGFHPSLLPAYRGGSAVKWQLRDGATALGASLYRLLPGSKMDSGPLAAQERLVAPDPLTAGSLYRSAQDAGLRALVRALRDLADGTYSETPQDEALATWHPRLRPGQSPAEYLAHAVDRTPLEAHA